MQTQATAGLPVIDRSRKFLARSDEVIVRGCQGHKRSHKMLERGYPVFCEKAHGARFTDVDGNDYLDFLMGFGPIVLGHADEALNAAIAEQMAKGSIFSLASAREVRVAEKLREMLGGDQMLGFFLGGSGATTGSLRLARAYTGRDKIIRCGYHGWHEWTQPGTPGVPQAIADLTIEAPYGDLEALDELFGKHDNEVACVIMETVQHAGPPEGFLQGCVDVAHRHGALCIFDEIKTGFRVALGGAGAYYGIQPDLSVFGKACCNGYPGSFVAGKREILSVDACQEAWLAATFHCDLLSLTAMETTLEQMQQRDGIAHQWRLGERLMNGINAACEEAGFSYRLVGLPPMPQPIMDEAEKPRVIRMLLGALKRGVYLHPGHVMFLSLAHTDADIDLAVQAVEEAAAEVAGQAG